MECPIVETSKTQFYLRIVLQTDAPIQKISLLDPISFMGVVQYMSCKKIKIKKNSSQYIEALKLPVTNLSCVSVILASGNKIIIEL